MEKHILELQQVSMVYGTVNALTAIDLHVREGEWLAIMGPSGSGKTTLMNIIGCMDKPSFGKVVLDGQQFHLVSYLTALENVMMAQYYHSMVDEREAMAALERVGLGMRASHLPSQLSGGEQQRVCIARALINYPRLILADEPTGNLDGENEEIVMNIFRQLHDEGSSIIMVTHSLEVAAHAQRHIVLEHGRIVKWAESKENRAAVSQMYGI